MRNKMAGIDWERIRNGFAKVRSRIRSDGVMTFLYRQTSRIEFPPNGFSRYGVDRFMEAVAKTVGDGELVLDAGSGHGPYRHQFHHVRYHCCDHPAVLKATQEPSLMAHTFYCDLEHIPIQSDTYDAVVSNQVIEHVRHPQRVVDELFRVLKPGGRLYLTAPQCFGLHMAPHNYYNFLCFGLNLLFEEAGFRVVTIRPLGGIFWLAGKVIQKSYETILSRMSRRDRDIFFPLHLIMRLAIAILCCFLFHLDRFDTDKDWTLTYGCCCRKPG